MRFTYVILAVFLLSLASLVSTEDKVTKNVPDDVPNDDVSRVKIKVFRGPTKEKNGEQFATWGFWIKQPADVA